MVMILGKMGEVVLKGLNRKAFENRMLRSLKYRLSLIGNYKVYSAQSTVYVEPLDESADMEAAFDIVRKIFGLVAVSKAYSSEKNIDAIVECAKKNLASELRRIKTFKVESRRSDKSFHLKSPEISGITGGALLQAFPHLRVDVHHPDVTVYVEIREQFAFVHTDPVPGAGGLPIGSSGKAAVLLSGGIDSPVAAQRMARRGIELDAIHFYSYPYTSERAKQKVITLTKILSEYCGHIPLHIVPFTKIQEEIRANCPEEYFTLLMRRSMMRISERIALQNDCSALITGESLGQVASQTLQAMSVTEQAITLPVLRPLVGMDKEEIVTIAREIGTLETSNLPYEDCCTVFTPRRPKTKPKLDKILEIEKAVPFGELEREAAENCEKLVISCEYDG
ncbi:MAG: tRNA 4-thiouridine(8) synthase ThiI [Clostridiales bacterium]|nr:tRNA 4-thiouridine(8) synthase ThiI [Clostridiales bacterium]